MSAKKEARLRQVEEKILQYKAVVEYLSKKSDVASIPHSNQVCIENVLLKGGWKLLGGSWCKDGQKLDLIQAGIKEFGDQYDRLRREHLRKTVKTFKDG
jgi:hypothetical protein